VGGPGAGIPPPGAEGQQLEPPGCRAGTGHRQADAVAEDQTAQHPAAEARRQILPVKDRPGERARLARHRAGRRSNNPSSGSKACRFQNCDIGAL